MGTVVYMSPEQARGEDVDARGDVFACGAVLYEMATGTRAFDRPSAALTFDAILHEAPRPPREINSTIPPRLDEIVAKALEKEPDLRYQSASELRADLKRLRRDMESSAQVSAATAATNRMAVRPESTWPDRRWTAVAGAAAAAVVLLTIFLTRWSSSGPARPSADAVTTRQVTFNPAEQPIFLAAISPDAKYLAYADLGGIHLRQIDTGETHLLPVPDGFCFHCPNLTWLPDSTSLLASGPGGPDQVSSIWAISIVGGRLQKLRDNAWLAAPSPDGSLVAFITANYREIWLMTANGDEPHKLLGLGSGSTFLQVAWSPDGKRVAYLRNDAFPDDRRIEAYDPATARTQVLWRDPRLRNFYWTTRGRIVGTISDPNPNAFAPAHSDLWMVDVRNGSPTPPRQLTNFAGFTPLSLSATADGQQLSVVRNYEQSDVYVGELRANASQMSPPKRLTLDDRIDWPGGWTRDSRTLLFYSDRQGTLDLFKQRIDEQSPELLLRGADEKRHPQLDPDARGVLYLTWSSTTAGTPPTAGRIMRVPLAGGPPQFVLDVRGYPGSIQTPRGFEETKVLTTSGNPDFRCSQRPGAVCVLSEGDATHEVFSVFDAAGRRNGVVANIATTNAVSWDLSPDGSQIAEATIELADRIRILPTLPGGRARDVRVEGFRVVASVGWASDGASLFVSGTAPDGGSIIRHVSFDGSSQLLYRANAWLERPMPSPDSRYLAFGQATSSSNVWMVQNFE
jgi:Tol biopolymer transport system component